MPEINHFSDSPVANHSSTRPRLARASGLAIFVSPDPGDRALPCHWCARGPRDVSHVPTTEPWYDRTRQGSNRHSNHDSIGQGLTTTKLPTLITVRTDETRANMQVSFQAHVATNLSESKHDPQSGRPQISLSVNQLALAHRSQGQACPCRDQTWFNMTSTGTGLRSTIAPSAHSD
jgi:hypothetical protein